MSQLYKMLGFVLNCGFFTVFLPQLYKSAQFCKRKGRAALPLSTAPALEALIGSRRVHEAPLQTFVRFLLDKLSLVCYNVVTDGGLVIVLSTALTSIRHPSRPLGTASLCRAHVMTTLGTPFWCPFCFPFAFLRGTKSPRGRRPRRTAPAA